MAEENKKKGGAHALTSGSPAKAVGSQVSVPGQKAAEHRAKKAERSMTEKAGEKAAGKAAQAALTATGVGAAVGRLGGAIVEQVFRFLWEHKMLSIAWIFVILIWIVPIIGPVLAGLFGFPVALATLLVWIMSEGVGGTLEAVKEVAEESAKPV